ncbi:MAG: SIS domain-containing protein [Bacteroidales bacterium]|nr:SIS domain-containing protein [Bacteroidales bacterium]
MQIRKIIENSIREKEMLLADDALLSRIEMAAAWMVAGLQQGGKICFCGNGGSAADAQHLAAELSGRFYFDRPPLDAEALHCNTSYLTAVSNDYGYEQVYARAIRACARPGNILIALSASGNSPNILNACVVAQELHIPVIALTGKNGGQMKLHADILLDVPSNDTPRIQEMHIFIGHILCQWIEEKLFERQKTTP